MSFTKWKGNLGKMNSLAMSNWEEIEQAGLINIVAEASGKHLVDERNLIFLFPFLDRK